MTKKSTVLLITTIIFFLLINTTYFWEGTLGPWAMLCTLMLIVTFVILAIAGVHQIYLAIKERLSNRPRLILIGIMAAILLCTWIKPAGIIDFEKYEGKDVFIAMREGAASCHTALKLKQNNKFSYESICFGFIKHEGTFILKNDTLIFNNVTSRDSIQVYAFGILKPDSMMKTDRIIGDIDLYRGMHDTLPLTLFIVKNELKK